MIAIRKIEHVGIRVSDRQQSLEFYQQLGFEESLYLPEHQASELVNQAGIYLNLIYSGKRREKNILLDTGDQYTGITHIAFVIDNMDDFVAWCQRRQVKITEGPKAIGPRRMACFIRDLDGNVLEFNQLEFAEA